MKGSSVPLSLPRRLATEFSYAARRVPRATLSMRLDLTPLVAARELAAERPPWSALFARAYGLAAQQIPALRQIYVQLPWPRLYQLPAAVGCVVIARDWQGEPALFFARIKDPGAQPLAEIAARIREAKTAPVESLRDNRRALAVARLPWPLRRLLFWLGLNLGRQVPNWYGSFGVSVLGAERVAISSVIAPWAGFLNYGPIGPDGVAEVFFSFDHRVMDGLAGARALQALERMLLGPVLAELRGLAQAPRPEPELGPWPVAPAWSLQQAGD
ncbi:MAG: hypothetical protein JWP04_1044 [Belnapia sp.]|nr:hypothetical protein [Belnapia sp.]